MKLLLLVVLTLSTTHALRAQTAGIADSGTPASSEWSKLVDSFFDGYFKLNPTQGTTAGFHQYDSDLEDYSRKGVDHEIAFAKDYLGRLNNFESKSLSLEERQDYQLLVNNLKSTLLDLEDIRSWEKNPDHYSSGLTNSAFVIMSRKFAPPEKRLRSLIDREKSMPAVLLAARENLKNPPRIYTEVAIQQLPDIVGFFQKDVPEAFKDVKDQQLLSEFQNSNTAVITALQDYEKFLKETLLARSNGDFRLGAENYRKKLLYDEMVDIPVDRLLQIGYDDLHRNQQWFKKVAAQIDPQKSPEQIQSELQQDHPAPDQLLQTFRDDLGGIRQYLIDKQIVTIPSPVPPIVEETPPFARALTFASMDTPGPYEKVAKEAFFNVTLPEADWTKERTESFMGQFNRETMIAVAVHEVYPGHYVQFLWLPSVPSKARKLLGCGSNAEGWAHYSEQMMLDEGYGNGDPKLRLGQLQDALLRDARYIVGISMHTGKMSFDDAVQFFQKEGYQPRTVAEVETKRGTSDPTYLVYTLGKLEIMKLREDYKQKMGASFSLQKFHDTFLQQGFPPIKIVRETMLGDESPTL
ncbi:MAG: DUF885 domain-containing protein [Candidatus Sulfotelmatobacter sp.]|jgi:uncharacterized protein (DUF885 family)